MLKTPNKDFYIILRNKNQYITLRPGSWSKDSIIFDVCNPIEDSRGISSNYLEYYDACNNKVSKISLSKKDILETKCMPEYNENKKVNYCKIIPGLNEKNPFMMSQIIKFNGVDMKIEMGWNKSETTQKTISIQNKGLPIILNDIRSSDNKEIKIVGNNLPLGLGTNSRVELIVPLEKRLLPNSYRNQYKPYNFKILVETKKNGEEIYEVNFKNNNKEINSNDLRLNWN